MLSLAFPAIDPVAFEIGPLPIRWYALAYLAGFVGGWRYAVYLARRRSGPPSAGDIDDLLTWVVIATILGGRLGYVLFYNPAHFLEHPGQILAVWQGGMSFHGGLLGVVLAVAWFARARRIPPLALGDVVAPAVPIGLFFGRIANFINGELYGRPTDLPWGMVFPAADAQPRHPSQLYEAALEGVLLFAVLAVLAGRPGVQARAGLLTGVFLAGYGIVRFLVEFTRAPDQQLAGLVAATGLSMGQLLSVPMVAIGIWLMVRARPTHDPAASKAA